MRSKRVRAVFAWAWRGIVVLTLRVRISYDHKALGRGWTQKPGQHIADAAERLAEPQAPAVRLFQPVLGEVEEGDGQWRPAELLARRPRLHGQERFAAVPRVAAEALLARLDRQQVPRPVA